MDKKELIESIAHLPSDCSRPRPMIDKLTTLELIKLLDEPQKVTVPQYVADWYEKHKDDFEFSIWDYVHMFNNKDESDFTRWLSNSETNAFQILVNMHQFGYEIEKEKRYEVKITASDQYLVNATDENFLGFLQSRLRTKFTKKELEKLGFGWVFDCPGIEIEEVEGMRYMKNWENL